MEKFYCNKCNEDIILKNGICTKCGTNWEKLISVSADEINSVSLDKPSLADEYEETEIVVLDDVNLITMSDINNNVHFFLAWATILKIICFVIALIFIFCTFFLYNSNDTRSLWFLVPCMFFCLFGFVIENNLKWKAYMLFTNLKHDQRLSGKK